MDQAQYLLLALWEPFSFLVLFGYTGLGILLGMLLGSLLVLFLQRRGWLSRTRRGHQLLLKLYFVLLPLAGGAMGLQGGLLYGSQQQINSHIDSYAPALQTVADAVWVDFQGYLASHDMQALADEVQGSTVQGLINQVALDYLRGQTEADAEQLGEASTAERIAMSLMRRVRAILLGQALGRLAVEKTAAYSHLDEQVLQRVLDARIEQLFDAAFLVELFQQQVGHVFKPFYLAVLMQCAMLLGILAGELLLSRQLRQLPKAASTTAVTLA
jgi:hypothetical protein